jgi:hypothetical protein
MTDKVALTITITVEQRERIEAQAQERGYESPDDYLLALVESDVDDEADMTKEEVLEDLRESIREAMTGKTIPAKDFLAALDDDD